MIGTRTRPSAVLEIAQGYCTGGLSVIPIRPDGTKRPSVSWKEYQRRLPAASELDRWFGYDTSLGVAVICGMVSGGLEVLDFDDTAAYFAWSEVIEQQAPGILARLPTVQTPAGGFHVYYRLERPAGNKKLALGADRATLIETRGEGGYVLAPGCPPECHETRGLYQHISGPALTLAPRLRDLR